MAATSVEDVNLDASALDELNSPEAKALLDTIDKLRSIQIGDIISLPQIIVVGDQSSGKSSVLEAISRVPFPVKGDLCTRFATELVLRRSSTSYVNVTIRFAKTKDASREQEPFRRANVDLKALPSLIEEATERMGIRPGSATEFSRDVLRIEVSGPDVPSLTLVDLPGFYHASTAEQSLEGKKVVNRLVKEYMAQEQSIMLAVVSANAQLAQQKILDEVRQHDPKRLRTIGVITKPDLPKPGLSDEAKYLQLAGNKEPTHFLNLGWHVLRNRAEDEGDVTPDERDATEARFFETSAWASFPAQHKGISSFRRKLGGVLLSHIQKTLPGLVADIQRGLEEKGSKLRQLGQSRSTQQEMRTHLTAIAEKFQLLARDAINGSYIDPFFGDLEEKSRKLRARLRNLNSAFHHVLLTKGMSRQILRGNMSVEAAQGAIQPPTYLEEALDNFSFPMPKPVYEDSLKKEMMTSAAANQGREFPGSAITDLSIQLFRRQAKPWRSIATRHLEVATELAKSFVEEVFEHVIGDDKTTLDAVLRSCVDAFFDLKREELKSKLDELLRPYDDGFGMPLVAEFKPTMSAREVERVSGRVTEVMHHMSAELRNAGMTGEGIDPRLVTHTVQQTSSLRDEFGIDQTIDNMEAYYEMSRRTFTENVAYLALESCLVRQIPKILTGEQVSLMEDDKVEELAMESDDVVSERSAIQTEADLLRDALEICRRFKPRGNRGLTSRRTPSPISPSPSPSSEPEDFGFSPARSQTSPDASPLSSVSVTPASARNTAKDRDSSKSRADVSAQAPPTFKLS